MIVIMLLIYCFGILAVYLIQPNADLSAEYNKVVEDNFSDLWSAMLTLFQGAMLDSIAAVYRPIIKEMPAMFLYFSAFLLTVSIALMNLVTAIIVNNSVEQSANDREVQALWEREKKKGLIRKLGETFKALQHVGPIP